MLLRVLVQAAPARLDLTAIQTELAGIFGAVDVHDLYAWTRTSDIEDATPRLPDRTGAAVKQRVASC